MYLGPTVCAHQYQKWSIVTISGLCVEIVKVGPTYKHVWVKHNVNTVQQRNGKVGILCAGTRKQCLV